MLRVIADAAAGDPEIAEAWADYERRRLQDARLLMGAFEPWFRPGLDVDRATEIFWGVFSHVPIDNLVRVCGWSAADYADFWVDAVERLLLT